MKNNSERLSDILSWLDSISYIKTEKIPEVDLYMDQVTSFMEEHLKKTKRSPEDKALTKTMINNYAKNRLLPAPVRKKYSKEHILLLLFIYYYKNLLSIGDIEQLFRPVTEQHFHIDSGLNLSDLRRSIFPRSPSDGSPERGYPCKIRRQLSYFHGHRQRRSGVSAAVCLYQRTFLRCLSKKAHDRDADRSAPRGEHP